MKNILLQSTARNYLSTSAIINNPLKREVYELIKERDYGQNTKNPFILVNRIIKNRRPVTLPILNEVLFNSLGYTISEKEFEAFLTIKPISLPFPITQGDSRVIKVIGRDLNKNHPDSPTNRKAGVYVFTNKTNGYQYVGSSINLAHRVRTYGHGSKLNVKRPITNAIRKGENLGLKVYIINTSSAVFATSNLVSLTLALEQYIILSMQPEYNVIKLVGRAPTTTGKLVGNKAKKPVYIYNNDYSTLLYVFPSQKDLVADTSTNKQTVTNCLNSGKVIYGTYILSRVELTEAIKALVTHNEIVDMIKDAKGYQYKVRPLSSHIKSQIQAVKLTDTTNRNKTMKFESKNRLCQYTQEYFPERRVGRWQLKGEGPFIVKKWLIELYNKF
jgi:hypothetical protein